MNNEYRCEWVLAQLKRNINFAITKAKELDEFDHTDRVYTKVLRTIASLEADSVLGTDEMMEDYIKQVTEGGEHDG